MSQCSFIKSLVLFFQENFSDFPFSPVSHTVYRGWTDLEWSSRAAGGLGSGEAGVVEGRSDTRKNRQGKDDKTVSVMQQEWKLLVLSI